MIAGLDPSTKRIGYAAPDGRLWSITARAGADDPARRLHELGRQLERLIAIYPPKPALVILEGYGYDSPGRLSLVRLGELGGLIRVRLFELGIPYLEIPPKQLKRYATGNGNAKKDAMIAAALEICREPNRTRLAAPLNDDEADAFHLRHLGRMGYGLEPLELGPKLEILSEITFPALPALVPSELTKERSLA